MIFKYQKIILTLELIAVVAVTIYSGTYALNAPTPVASVTETEAESIEKTVKESKRETARTEETKKKDKKSETKAVSETVKKVVENKSETSVSAPGSKNNSGASGGNSNNSSGVSSGNKNNSQPSGTNNSGNAGNANQNTAPSSPSTPAAPAPSTSAPTTPQTEHTHNWVEQTHTVHHDATGHYEEVVVQEAWDEPVYEMELHWYCNTCGLDITSDPVGHLEQTDCGGYHSVYESVQTGSIHHDAVTESKWVEDNPAWYETVRDGYVCSGCGAAK